MLKTSFRSSYSVLEIVDQEIMYLGDNTGLWFFSRFEAIRRFTPVGSINQNRLIQDPSLFDREMLNDPT